MFVEVQQDSGDKKRVVRLEASLCSFKEQLKAFFGKAQGKHLLNALKELQESSRKSYGFGPRLMIGRGIEHRDIIFVFIRLLDDLAYLRQRCREWLIGKPLILHQEGSILQAL